MSNMESYDLCWLRHSKIHNEEYINRFGMLFGSVYSNGDCVIAQTALSELMTGINGMTGISPVMTCNHEKPGIILSLIGKVPNIDALLEPEETESILPEGFLMMYIGSADDLVTDAESNIYGRILISARTGRGLMYGVYRFLSLLAHMTDLADLYILDNPRNPLRLINHWDNMDGSIERGYAGRSIFYRNNELTKNPERIKAYARLLASVGINGAAVNNVNVHKTETRLIDDKIDIVRQLADVFRPYGIRVFLSINYASPMEIGGLPTADPLDDRVAGWWKDRAEYIYSIIPDLGGFLVKADSENRPGPFTYGRNHADGANMLAAALKPYGGLLIWRCFVYNCQQDWRDLSIDRAKAAYDNYRYLDGSFADNVILQIKNGPMDFQVREPVSPLIGAMEYTNQMLELQITQEYTGQQRHLCYLVPQWKEILDFDTYAKGEGSPIKRVVDGTVFGSSHCGMAAVSNIGDDYNWTGHYLAQANLYGYGRLCWNPDLTEEEITREWIIQTFGSDTAVIDTISDMLSGSWHIYESYTSPLGIGWMVNPGYHYGPNVDGYEYSKWGTYHRADHEAIGVDRTVARGTGFTAQYKDANYRLYESPETCPEELLLFFHRMPYSCMLKTGKTIIQHIYDTHFDGAEKANELIEKWKSLQGRMDDERFRHVLERLNEQADHAKEWRDVINSYFYRKTGIPDKHGRTIY